MSCARPLIRVYNPNDHNITGSIMTLETYRERAHNPTATYESLAYRTDVMLLPCGKCLGCRLRQRQDWETRMLMESKTLTPVWFLTLTWNQEYVPGMVRETISVIKSVPVLSLSTPNASLTFFSNSVKTSPFAFL